jgi:D-alanyl-lipoteichoic acid acyltransferase DltB (MBOAT superfamily)
MQLISVQFLIFSITVLAVYWLLARKAQNIWLLLVSYFFYGTFNRWFAVVLFAVTIINFFLGQRARSRPWFTLGILLNLSSFMALKLISGPYASLLLPFPPDVLNLLLPVGFSFYILQAISYLVDIHNGTAEPADSLLDFALYLSYFPKLLAGPIERAASFLSKLQNDRHVDAANLTRGMGLILIGLVRKVVLADRLSLFLPPTVFSDPSGFSALEKIIWLLVYIFRLYNDFAGYTSIVRGLSALMGIELSPNFRQPFFATSLSDFWTRWHISLSFWLRDYIFVYVYVPLRRWLIRNHRSQYPAVILPPILTMLASGFWHGAYASIMVWGGLHGLYVVLEQLLKPLRRSMQTMKAVSSLFVFFIITLTWIPFAASSLGSAVEFFQGLFNFTFQVTSYIPIPDLFAALLLTLWLDWQEARHGMDAFFLKWKPSAQAWGLAAAIWILILFLSPGLRTVTFVYQGF